MKAMILAGGFGTRLQGEIGDLPKPMAMICGKPFLEHQIMTLIDQDVKDVILCVHHKKDMIKSYFGDGGRRLGIKITYSDEDSPLGTGGAIKNAEKFITDDEPFFVFNGDSYSDINLQQFLEFHNKNRGIATMSLNSVDDGVHFGSVILEGDKVIDFAEKTETKDVLINSGVYIFDPKIFSLMEREKNVSLEKEVFPVIAKNRELYGYIYEGYFMDIGRPETYKKFKSDLLENLVVRPEISVRDSMRLINKNRTDLVLVVDDDRKFLGVLNDNIIRKYLTDQNGELDINVTKAMVTNPAKIGYDDETEERIHEILLAGTRFLPIISRSSGRLEDVRFYNEEIKNEAYPVVSGRAPLRISFAGGGTDVAHFFDKYGGIVINTTIDKHCHGTAMKRADSKVVINSDLKNEDYIFNINNIIYDGNFDVVKAVVNIIKPNFGFELYLNNDVMPGRGLGSSASLAVLVSKFIKQMEGTFSDDEEIAQIAYEAERRELGIKGGWQDQYAAVTGGFSYMEFEENKRIIHPLRLKKEIINELDDRLILCYIGKDHHSGKMHESQENSYQMNESEISEKMKKMKDIAVKIKDSLLQGNLDNIGYLLDESWILKKSLDNKISNIRIDELYEIGKQNGAYGGKLLGAGGGGYILFYYPIQKRNKLVRALEKDGGEIMDFNFESQGTRVWNSRK